MADASVSLSVIPSPVKTCVVATLVVSVSRPAAPVAVEVAVPKKVGLAPLMERAAVSALAPLSHAFCSLTVAELRVLVNVQVIVAPRGRVPGTVNPPAPLTVTPLSQARLGV